MNKETAWTEVITRLGTIPGINKVYEGFHEVSSISDANKPCIMVEPDNTEVLEDNYDESGGNYGLEQLNLIVIILFIMYEKGKAVTGKTDAGVNMLGIFEWEKLVKDKLAGIPEALSYKVAKVGFGNVSYLRSVGIETKEMVRLVAIEVGLIIPYST